MLFVLQASGEALYSYDMPEEREGLYAAFVGSREPLAVIKGIDASEALKIEGVVAFLDAKDVPGENKSDVEEVFASKKVGLAQQCLHFLNISPHAMLWPYIFCFGDCMLMISTQAPK